MAARYSRKLLLERHNELPTKRTYEQPKFGLEIEYPLSANAVESGIAQVAIVRHHTGKRRAKGQIALGKHRGT